LPVVHDLVDEIRALLQAEGNTADKDELLDKLQRLLQKYPALKDTSFQPSISQFIYIESKNQCALDLDEDEVSGLWGVITILLLFVSECRRTKCKRKGNGCNCLYADLPPPYATVTDDLGAGGYR
jgi:hypothetical protein